MKKIWKSRRLDEEGEMGVGTLLIFIAMILVAAVAASVLVQTAYKLQQQAESTGDEALAEVATGFRVLSVWGMTDAASAVIDTVFMKVTLTAGSPGINLANTVIEATQTIGGSTSSEVTLSYASAADADEFTASELRDMAPTTTAAMMTGGDVFQIELNLNSTGGIDMELDVQEQITVVLFPKHGIPTYIEITSPPTLEVNSVVSLK